MIAYRDTDWFDIRITQNSRKKQERGLLTDRQLKEHVAIMTGLRERTCKCRWIFFSENHDRYRFAGDCKQPCEIRDVVLAKINAV